MSAGNAVPITFPVFISASSPIIPAISGCVGPPARSHSERITSTAPSASASSESIQVFNSVVILSYATLCAVCIPPFSL